MTGRIRLALGLVSGFLLHDFAVVLATPEPALATALLPGSLLALPLAAAIGAMSWNRRAWFALLVIALCLSVLPPVSSRLLGHAIEPSALALRTLPKVAVALLIAGGLLSWRRSAAVGLVPGLCAGATAAASLYVLRNMGGEAAGAFALRFGLQLGVIALAAVSAIALGTRAG